MMKGFAGKGDIGKGCPSKSKGGKGSWGPWVGGFATPLAVAKAVARKAGKVTYPYYMLVTIMAKVGQKPRPTSETANWFGE